MTQQLPPGTGTPRPDATRDARPSPPDGEVGDDSTLARVRADDRIDAALDAACDLSFPASDPPAWMGSVARVGRGDR